MSTPWSACLGCGRPSGVSGASGHLAPLTWKAHPEDPSAFAHPGDVPLLVESGPHGQQPPASHHRPCLPSTLLSLGWDPWERMESWA